MFLCHQADVLNDLDDISELFSDSQLFGRNAAAAGSGRRYKKKGRARESGADSSEGEIDVLDDSQGDEPEDGEEEGEEEDEEEEEEGEEEEEEEHDEVVEVDEEETAADLQDGAEEGTGAGAWDLEDAAEEPPVAKRSRNAKVSSKDVVLVCYVCQAISSAVLMA